MVEDWVMKLPLNLIYCAASDFKLSAYLVASIVAVESGGELSKTRYEPEYKWLHEVEKHAGLLRITKDTEEVHQKTSWGMMQVMGATARWLGYKEDLPRLIKPSLNLRIGCQYLKHLKNKYGNMEDVIAAYNAGSPRKNGEVYENQKYVDTVKQYFWDLTK